VDPIHRACDHGSHASGGNGDASNSESSETSTGGFSSTGENTSVLRLKSRPWLERRVRDLSALLNVTRALGTVRDIDTLLGIILEKVSKVMDAERTSVFLVDEHSRELVSRVAQGAGQGTIRLPIGVGIAGAVAMTGQTINILDAYADPRFNKQIDVATGYRTKHILTMPIRSPSDDRVVGVIQVLNKAGDPHPGSIQTEANASPVERRDDGFTKDDENLLSAFVTQAAVALENASLHEENQRLFESTIRTISKLVDARDPVTAGHSDRVCAYSMRLGETLHYEPTRMKVLQYAALLHDVGKIGVRDAVLQKPGKLEEDEYRQIQTHVVFTRRVLDHVYFPRGMDDIPDVAGSHHERWDGGGYPNKLNKEESPEGARVLAIADVFDALTAWDRPYKPALPLNRALKILESERGKAFEARLVDLFIDKELYRIDRSAPFHFANNRRIVYDIKAQDNAEAPLLAEADNPALVFTRGTIVPEGSVLEVEFYRDTECVGIERGEVVDAKQVGDFGEWQMTVAFESLFPETSAAFGDVLSKTGRKKIEGGSRYINPRST
jgi:HD-GYP domain-containing protein (c-di-GMP phosphodiesterase class II)